MFKKAPTTTTDEGEDKHLSFQSSILYKFSTFTICEKFAECDSTAPHYHKKPLSGAKRRLAEQRTSEQKVQTRTHGRKCKSATARLCAVDNKVVLPHTHDHPDGQVPVKVIVEDPTLGPLTSLQPATVCALVQDHEHKMHDDVASLSDDVDDVEMEEIKLSYPVSGDEEIRPPFDNSTTLTECSPISVKSTSSHMHDDARICTEMFAIDNKEEVKLSYPAFAGDEEIHPLDYNLHTFPVVPIHAHTGEEKQCSVGDVVSFFPGGFGSIHFMENKENGFPLFNGPNLCSVVDADLAAAIAGFCYEMLHPPSVEDDDEDDDDPVAWYPWHADAKEDDEEPPPLLPVVEVPPLLLEHHPHPDDIHDIKEEKEEKVCNVPPVFDGLDYKHEHDNKNDEKEIKEGAGDDPPVDLREVEVKENYFLRLPFSCKTADDVVDDIPPPPPPMDIFHVPEETWNPLVDGKVSRPEDPPAIRPALLYSFGGRSRNDFWIRVKRVVATLNPFTTSGEQIMLPMDIYNDHVHIHRDLKLFKVRNAGTHKTINSGRYGKNRDVVPIKIFNSTFIADVYCDLLHILLFDRDIATMRWLTKTSNTDVTVNEAGHEKVMAKAALLNEGNRRRWNDVGILNSTVTAAVNVFAAMATLARERNTAKGVVKPLF